MKSGVVVFIESDKAAINDWRNALVFERRERILSRSICLTAPAKNQGMDSQER